MARFAGLVLGAVFGWILGAWLSTSSLCIPGISGLFGCLDSSFAFLQLPSIILFALVGFWLGGKL